MTHLADCRVRVLVAWLVLLVPGCGSADPDGSDEPLSLTLTLPGPTALYRQQVEVTMVARNVGDRDLAIATPPLDPAWPIVRVRDAATGTVSDFRGRRSGGEERFAPGILHPRDAFRTSFQLLPIVGALAPGRYEISALLGYDGEARLAESAPLGLDVQPTTARSLALVDVVAGDGSSKFGVWVDVASGQASRCVRSFFGLRPGGGYADPRIVANCPASARPVLSMPRAGSALRSHWVAWLEPDELHHVHFDDLLGASAAQTTAVAKDVLSIVAVQGGAIGDEGQRTSGSVLLMRADREQGFRLESMTLTEASASRDATVRVPGPLPVWTTAIAGPDSASRVLYLQSSDATIVMQSTAWPTVDRDTAKSRRIAAWQGSYLAAGVASDGQGGVAGAMLIGGPSGAAPGPLELVEWTLSASGEYAERRRTSLDSPTASQVREARVAVAGDGRTALLLQDEAGGWQAFTRAAGLVRVAQRLTGSGGPLEPAFLGDSEQPLVIAALPRLGFEIARPDGSPLPASRTPK